ncbi:MAG: CDP-alcohol phosphatidyltransferase family protein [Gemmatimonadales bacterium]|nr:CDP-alcohol phosphatidyltransferase family protein [Gemmatimonadales bacterium]
MLANWITLSRLPLLLASVLILYRGSPPVRLAGAALLLVGLMLDTVDGVVARRTGQTSLIGSVLDIAADRMYELVLWVCFADLGLIPVAIPLIVLARTTLTDAFRSIGVGEGTAPFAQHRTAVARFLVGSPTMRIGYSVGKVTTFCGLALAYAGFRLPAGTPAILEVLAWVTVLLCISRGLPVIVDSLRGIRHYSSSAAVQQTEHARGPVAEDPPKLPADQRRRQLTPG